MRSGERIVFAEDVKRAVVLLDTNARGNGDRQFALRSFYLQLVADVDFYTGRQRNGLLTNSRHGESLLPNLTEQLAAHAFLAGIATRHYTTRRGQNVHTQTAENARDIGASDVHSAAGTRHALDGGDGRLIAGCVLEIETNGSLRAVFGQLEVDDVTLFLE